MRPVKRDKSDVEGAGETVWEGSEGVVLVLVVGFSIWVGLEGTFDELCRRLSVACWDTDDRERIRGQCE